MIQIRTWRGENGWQVFPFLLFTSLDLCVIQYTYIDFTCIAVMDDPIPSKANWRQILFRTLHQPAVSYRVYF